jgi:hypothetical protein
MTLTKKTDHVTEAQANLIALFNTKPYWLALVQAFVDEIQDLENAMWDLFIDYLATAVGDSLDQYGAIVGEDRLDRSDDDYRAAIQSRILLNLGNGTPEEIINLMESVANGGTVQLTEYFPAAFTVFVLKALTTTQALNLNAALQSAKPAGVKAHLIYGESDPSELFTYDIGPGYDQGKWATVLDPDADVILIRSRLDLDYLLSRVGDRQLITR